MLKESLDQYTQEDIETLESSVADLNAASAAAQETVDQLTAKMAELQGELKAVKDMNQKLVLTGGFKEPPKKSMEEILYENYGKRR